MKFEATLIGKVTFERKFTVYARNEDDAAEIAEEMFRGTLHEADECEVNELYINKPSDSYEILLREKK